MRCRASIHQPRRHIERAALVAMMVGSVCCACDPERASGSIGTESTEPVGAASGSDALKFDGGGAPDAAPSAPQEPACEPGPGTTGSPETVLDVVALVNSLPMPVTLPCFLRSLDRPLQLLATSNVISAQPAQGQDNPRLFIISSALSLSVVPTGDSRNLLEMGEITAPDRSIKGEILFPVSERLTPESPFARIAQSSERTVCYGCHFPEQPVPDYPVPGAFVSTAYRPIPRLEINFEYVEYQYETCDHAAEPDRCATFDAIFDRGQVSRGEFPADMPTFE